MKRVFVEMSVAQVAKYLRLSAQKVRKLIVSGPLVGFRRNGRLYVETQNLEKFVRRSAA